MPFVRGRVTCQIKMAKLKPGLLVAPATAWRHPTASSLRNVPLKQRKGKSWNLVIEYDAIDMIQPTDSVVNAWEENTMKSLILAIGFVSLAGMAFGANPRRHSRTTPS